MVSDRRQQNPFWILLFLTLLLTFVSACRGARRRRGESQRTFSHCGELERVFTFGVAVAVFVVFLARVVREPRSLVNAVLLGLALALGALGLAEHLASEPGRPAHLLLRLLLLAVALGPFLIGCFLVANGVTMIRRESLRPANLLSLVAGAAIFVVIGLDIAAGQAGDAPLSLSATVVPP